jgi:phytoene synthase
MDARLEQSFQFCRALARRSRSNFYLSFQLLPREKSDALCVIYAFMRHCDDLVDNAPDPDVARRQLNRLREQLGQRLDATAAEDGGPDFWMALAQTARRYHIPARHFHEVVNGCELDLTTARYETFEQLYRYCYGVASAVGLVCLRVFGFSDDAALKPAESLGIAFQLTNILRDIKEDAQRGRIYLPLEDLRQFEVTEQEILDGQWSQRFEQLVHFEAGRAEGFYTRAQPLLQLVDRDSRNALAAMQKAYHGILRKIQRPGFNVFERRARLAASEKLSILAQAKLGALLAEHLKSV